MTFSHEQTINITKENIYINNSDINNHQWSLVLTLLFCYLDLVYCRCVCFFSHISLSHYLPYFQRIKTQLQKQAEELKKSTQSIAPTNNSSDQNDNNAAQNEAIMAAPRRYLRGTVTNMMVVVGFAAFAMVVKHVLTNCVDTEGV